MRRVCRIRHWHRRGGHSYFLHFVLILRRRNSGTFSSRFQKCPSLSALSIFYFLAMTIFYGTLFCLSQLRCCFPDHIVKDLIFLILSIKYFRARIPSGKPCSKVCGTGSGSRTHTVAHWNLNPARLPIPPYPHKISCKFIILTRKSQ